MEIYWNKLEVLDQKNSKASKGHVTVCRQEFQGSMEERFQELQGVSKMVVKNLYDQLWIRNSCNIQTCLKGLELEFKVQQHPGIQEDDERWKLEKRSLQGRFVSYGQTGLRIIWNPREIGSEKPV